MIEICKQNKLKTRKSSSLGHFHLTKYDVYVWANWTYAVFDTFYKNKSWKWTYVVFDLSFEEKNTKYGLTCFFLCNSTL